MQTRRQGDGGRKRRQMERRTGTQGDPSESGICLLTSCEHAGGLVESGQIQTL